MPEGGKGAGCDNPELMQKQLLEDAGVDFAVLWTQVARHVPSPEDEAIVAAAANGYMADSWLAAYNRHERYRATILVAASNIPSAVREIETWGDHPFFVQAGFDPLGVAPLGSDIYDPLYAAAVKKGIPIGMHFIVSPGMNLMTPVGFMSYAMEFHALFPLAFACHVVSLVSSGVFDRFPELKVVLLEAGISWCVPLFWRMEKHWDLLPHEAKRRPLDYLRDNLRFSTQPIEEPSDPKALHKMLEWVGADQNVMFSTDYPHWDYDEPTAVLKRLPEALRTRIFSENARELYSLPRTRPAGGSAA
jgi:predicted TIM-barrel fold metal-dependent hydrolase